MRSLDYIMGCILAAAIGFLFYAAQFTGDGEFQLWKQEKIEALQRWVNTLPAH